MGEYRNIKGINLCFENVESVYVPANCIGLFYMDKIYGRIRYADMNKISLSEYCNLVTMEIFQEVNDVKQGYCFLGAEFDDIRYTPFERIGRYNDIVCIEICFDDGEKRTYYVDYVEKDENMIGAPNINQKTYVSKCGAVYIVIGKDVKIEDYFDMKNIENQRWVDFRKKINGILKGQD